MNLIELIFSTDFLYMWIRVATPILLASLGSRDLYQGRSSKFGSGGHHADFCLGGSAGKRFWRKSLDRTFNGAFGVP